MRRTCAHLRELEEPDKEHQGCKISTIGWLVSRQRTSKSFNSVGNLERLFQPMLHLHGMFHRSTCPHKSGAVQHTSCKGARDGNLVERLVQAKSGNPAWRADLILHNHLIRKQISNEAGYNKHSMIYLKWVRFRDCILKLFEVTRSCH